MIDTAIAHRGGHGAADDIARRKIAESMHPSHDRSPAKIDDHRTFAAHCLRDQGARVEVDVEHRGVKLHEFEILDGGPGSKRCGDSVTGTGTWARCGTVQLTCAAARDDDRRRSDDDQGALNEHQRPSGRAVVVDENLDEERVSQERNAELASSFEETSRDLSASGISTGMKDPRVAMSALEGERRAITVILQSNPAFRKKPDRVGSLAGELMDGGRIAESNASDHGVSPMGYGVIVPADCGRDATLGPGRRPRPHASFRKQRHVSPRCK
jgi:hypothetical protein